MDQAAKFSSLFEEDGSIETYEYRHIEMIAK